MRVVIDTNCWFAILPLGAAYSMVIDSLIDGEYTLIVSTDIILEYEEIIGRKLPKVDVKSFIAGLTLLPNVEQVTPKFHFDLIQSDKDGNRLCYCG